MKTAAFRAPLRGFLSSCRAAALALIGLAAGHPGTARAADYVLTFSNATQIVNTPAKVATADFTFEAWVKVHAYTSENHIFAQYVGGNAGRMVGFLQYTKMCFFVGGNYYFGNVSIPSNTWTHIAVTRSGSTGSIYVNGVLDKAQTVTTAALPSDGIRIGGTSNFNSGFRGQIADVRAWRLARTPFEICASMNTRLSGAESGLVGYWPVSDGSGASVNELVANADGAMAGTPLPVWAFSGDLPLVSSTTLGVWNAASGGNWSGAANWLAGAVPNGDAHWAVFTNQPTATLTITNDLSPLLIGRMVLSCTNGATFTGSSFTFTNISIPAALTVTGGDHAFDAPATLTCNGLTVDTSNPAAISLGGALSGPGGLTANSAASGGGRVTLSGANTYTGPTVLGCGTLAVDALANGGAASPIGASSASASNLLLGPGTLHYTGPSTATDRGFTLQAGSGRAAVLRMDDDLTVAGPVAAKSGAFIKDGDGTLSLTYPGTNTLSVYEPADLNALQNTGANGDSPTTGFSGLSIIHGRLELGVPGQTNICSQRIDIGMRTTTNANAETAGELVVNGGALLCNTTFSIGRGNGSTITAPGGLTPKLTINGGTVTCNLLALGYWGSIGTGYNCRPLCEINGGTLAINGCNLGESTGCFAVVSVRAGTLVSAGNINVGGTQVPAGTGILNLSGIGAVDVAADVSLGAAASGYGTLNLNGGTLIARNIVKGGGLSALLTFNGGRFQPRTEGRTLSGLTAAYVSTNGAAIDTALANYAVAQNLLHAPDAPGTDGGLVKLGTNTLTLSSYGSTYTGPTLVSNGTLCIAGALPADNALTVAADGEALIGGSATQTVTAARLTLAGGRLGFAFSVDGVANDRLTVASSPSIGTGSGISLYQLNTRAPFTKNGTYTLLTYTGSDPAAANLSCANAAYGKTYAFAASGGSLTVTIGSDASAASLWNTDGSGLWSTAANWTAAPSNAAGSQARFDSAITAPATVTSSGETVGEIFINNANAYTLGGSGLTLDNTARPALVNVESGAHSITAPLTLSDDTTLNLSPSTLLTLGAVTGASATLTAQGNGTLALTAAPSVQRLSLNVPEIGVSNTLTLAPPVALQRNVTVRPALSTTTTVSGVISGTANLTKAGSSTLSLGPANTYNGVTTVSAGTLAASALANGGSASSIGVAPSSSGNWLLGPATFHYTGPAAAINRGYTLNAGGRAAILKVDDALTLGGQCASWSGAIIKTGAGTLRYTYANGAQTLASYEGNVDFLLNTGANGDGPTTGFSGYTISNGKVVMGAAGQTNTINFRITIGHCTTTAAGAETAGELELVGGILNCNTTFSVGRGNGNAVTAPGGLSSRFTLNGGIANVNLIGMGYAGAAGANFNARPVIDINAGTLNVASDSRIGDSKGAVATVNVRGGTFRCSGQYNFAGLSLGGAQDESGTGILNLMGTGVVDIAHNVLLGAGWKTPGAGTLHLAGGMLIASNIVKGAGVGTVRFNGGTFFPRTPGRTMTGLTAAYVSTNGAVFDTSLADGYTVAQNLLHDPALGSEDGGLIKLGTNTLSLTGSANTFSGPVAVRGGLLRARLGATNDLFVAAAGVFDALGDRATVGDLSGCGPLTNGVIAVTGTLDAGTNGAPAGARMTVQNLSLTAGSAFACDWATNSLGKVTNDFVAVTGTLAPEGAGFVDFGRTEANPIPMPFSATIMSYGTLGGTFSRWKALNTGLPASVHPALVITAADGRVTVLVRYSGLLLMVK